jgi:hypothetical protein
LAGIRAIGIQFLIFLVAFSIAFVMAEIAFRLRDSFAYAGISLLFLITLTPLKNNHTFPEKMKTSPSNTLGTFLLFSTLAMTSSYAKVYKLSEEDAAIKKAKEENKTIAYVMG